MHQISQHYSSMLFKICKEKEILEVVKRQDDLRYHVKGVIPCDILCNSSPLVLAMSDHMTLFFSSLCLIITCTTNVSGYDLLLKFNPCMVTVDVHDN